jgi:hypothetical protein
MIRAGHDLKNMKHGDLHRVALELLARKSGDFETVDEFVDFRARVEREDYERSLQLQREVRGETENPRIDIQNLINVATERFQFQHGRRMLANQKKEQRAMERAREKEEWLRSQRGLFK